MPGGSGFTRSVSLEELTFNKDGSVSPFKMTNGITKAIAAVNPYSFNQAEMIAWSENVKSYQNKEAGVFIKAKKNGAYTSVKNVDFRKKGAAAFSARVGTTHNSDVTMSVHLDAVNGPVAATVKIPLTGGDDRWETVKVQLTEKITGVHDLYFVFNGKASTDIMYFDYWTFLENNEL
ncbi:carbohydrate-binding protein [Chryseobacterium sp. 1B4]